MTVSDIMFEEFFAKPIPADGFEIDPRPSVYPGLVDAANRDNIVLHGYEVTMDGKVVEPDLRPQKEEQTKEFIIIHVEEYHGRDHH